MNWIADTLGIMTQSVTLPGWVVVVGAAVVALLAFVLLARAEPTERPLTLFVLIGMLLGGMAVGTSILKEVQANNTVSEARALEVRAAALDAAAAEAGLGCLNADAALQAACEVMLFERPENIAAARALLRARFALVEDAFEFVRRRRSPILLDRIAVWRRPLERDPYGIVAAMLLDMRSCSVSSCPQVAFLGDVQQVNANLAGDRYAALVAKYTPMWERAARNRGSLVTPTRTGPFGFPLVDQKGQSSGAAPGEAAGAGEPPQTMNLPVEPRETAPALPPPATAAPLPPPRPPVSAAPTAPARPRPQPQAARPAPPAAAEPEPAPPAAQ